MNELGSLDRFMPLGKSMLLAGIFFFILAAVSLFKLGRLNKGRKITNISKLEAEFNRLTRVAMFAGIIGGLLVFASLALLIINQVP